MIRLKKFLSVFFVVLCLGVWGTADTAWAASGKTSVSVSSGNVNIGDTITVTVKCSGPSGEKANSTMTLSYDTNVLQFVSCSATYGGGGSSVMATGESYTVTLKAVGAGKSSLSVSGNDGVIFDTAEELEAMSGSSASVTVNNAASTGNAAAGSTSAGTTGTTGSTTGTTGTTGSTAGTTDSTANAQDNASDTANKSADNSLKTLTISPGTLSPEFKGSTTKYTAVVGSDVNSIAVTAVPVNAKAVVEAVTGNEVLKDGVNTIKIVVKAENGVTATYTIEVTRQAGGTPEDAKEEEKEEEKQEEEADTETAEVTDSALMINGTAYEITDGFQAEDIPAGFAENTINYHGTEYHGVSFYTGTLNLLWLMPAGAADAQGRFFIYEESIDAVYPFVKLGIDEKYVIPLVTPADAALPETYTQTSIMLGETDQITAYQRAVEETDAPSDFYLFYAMNQDGTSGWYQYDALEETYQRLAEALTSEEEMVTDSDLTYLQQEYEALNEKYKKEKSFSRNVIAVSVFLAAVLFIIIINLLLHRSKSGEDMDDFEDRDDLWDDHRDDLESAPKQMPENRKVHERKRMPKRESDALEEESTKESHREEAIESVTKEKKRETKSEKDDLEIIDFNDL